MQLGLYSQYFAWTLIAYLLMMMQDPLADGPTIQAASTRALASHTTLDKVGISDCMWWLVHICIVRTHFISGCLQVINAVSRVSPQITAPIVLFTYYNIIMRRGPEKFCQQIKAAGAAGLMLSSSTFGIHRSLQENCKQSPIWNGSSAV